MRNVIVPKGWHMAINQLPVVVSTDTMSKEIVFTDSCRYLFDNEDQFDWLKLCGFSIGLLPVKGVKPMHHNSVRFAWRYDLLTNAIQISPYWYVNEERHYAETDGLEIAEVKIGQKCKYYISKTTTGYIFCIRNENDVIVKMWKIKLPHDISYGWSACLFFGGNQTAPHKITVKMGSL
jgi:hypothetical protein